MNNLEKKLTPKLKSYKDEFDFLHKKIGELEWEIATISYGRKAVPKLELDTLFERLDNYTHNIKMLVQSIKEEVAATNKSK